MSGELKKISMSLLSYPRLHCAALCSCEGTECVTVAYIQGGQSYISVVELEEGGVGQPHTARLRDEVGSKVTERCRTCGEELQNLFLSCRGCSPAVVCVA